MTSTAHDLLGLPSAPRDFAISGRVVASLAEAVEGYGVPRERLLSRARLEPGALADGRVLCSDFYRLSERALELCDEPALGLRWHDNVRRNPLNPVALMLQHAATLRSAFEALARCGRLLSDHTGYTMIEQDDTVIVRCWVPSTSSPSAHRLASEIMLAGWFELIAAFGPTSSVHQVDFDYPAPRYAADYSRTFRGLARFERPHSQVVFERALMDAPSRGRDGEVHRALHDIAQRRIAQMREQAPYSQRVRDLLVRRGSCDTLSMASVARSLGVSERSLRRRLHEEGKPFNEVVEDARSLVARRLLCANRQPSMHELSQQLGFRGVSGFYRAFKRWTGTTPAAFRRAALTP